MKKLLILTTVISALVLAGCSSTQNSDASVASVSNSGQISALTEVDYDWQDIDIKGGDVSREFEFENSGDEDLVIKGATTSCMCTTATFTLPDGKNSPAFGMHANPEWAYAIKPGEKFSVDVVFDPMAHGPDAVGPIQRSVYIVSSSESGEYAVNLPDSADRVTEVKVSGDVLYSDEYVEKNGKLGFVFDETEYDFGIIKQSGGIVSYDFPFTYKGKVPVLITGTPSSCVCTGGEISNQQFESGDTGVLTVNFDPNLHAEPEGKFFKTVSILTDPELEEAAEVKIWVEIDLDLGSEAFKLQDDHDDDHENGRAFHNMSPDELKHDLENKDFFMVDVHIPEQEHIEKTDAFIPYNEIASNLDKLPEDKNEKIVVYCRSGSMSIEASEKLIELGYKNVYNLEGGRNAYIDLTN
jgi:rhodanese-related sulfurtransferase